MVDISLLPDLPEHVRLLVHLFHIDVHHATAFAREDVAAGQPRYDVYALHQSDRGLNHSVSLEAPLEDGFVVGLRGRNRPEVAPDLKPLAGYSAINQTLIVINTGNSGWALHGFHASHVHFPNTAKMTLKT